MKVLVPSYTFNASAKTITFTSYTSIELKRLLLITNTTSNTIIYNFASPTKGGTVATNVLTLTYNTTSMSNTDALQIYYDDASPSYSPNVTTIGTLTASASSTSAQTTATAVQITVPDYHSSWSVYLSGTFSATSQIYFEGSETGLDADWFNLNGRRNSDVSTNDSTNFLATNINGGVPPSGGNPSHWRGSIGGIKYFRVRCNAYTASDSIAVTLVTSTATAALFLNSAVTLAGLQTPGIKNTTVGTTAVQVDAQQSDRKVVEIKSLSTNTGLVYVGFASSVTSSGANTGRELTAGEALSIDLNPAFPVYAIGSATGQVVQVLEVS